MAKLNFKVKLNGAPTIGAVGNIETVSDVPRFLRAAEQAVRSAVKIFPELRGHKVVSITVREE